MADQTDDAADLDEDVPGDESFLPPDDDPVPDPDDELDALEADDDDDSNFIDEDDQGDVQTSDDPPPPLGLSWAFDFSTSTFLIQGGSPLETRGLATLRAWIEKCLMTARGAHPIEPPDYGLELPGVLGEPLDDDLGAGLEDAVRDALLFHPRITDVTDFETYQGELDDEDDPTYLTPEDEVLYVDFTVVTDDEETIDFISVPLRGN